MRTNIFHEGVDSFHTGTLVAPGALKLPQDWPGDKPMPVVVNFVPTMIIAWATEMQRDEDNRISFELEWFNDRFKRIYSDWSVGFYTQPVIEKFDDALGRRVATRAVIRGISYYDPNSSDMGRSLPV